MIEFNREPKGIIEFNGLQIPDFTLGSGNIDQQTIESFGEEWAKFSSFDESELQFIGDQYFDLLKDVDMSQWQVLDAGCGSGRWSRYLSGRVRSIDAIDPSKSILYAADWNRDLENIRFTKAEIGALPFSDQSFDMVFSLGVLHHIPDTLEALISLAKHVKNQGVVLLYLYYNLDNRGLLYRTLFNCSTLLRKFVSSRSPGMKKFLSDALALTIYLPLVSMAKIVRVFSQSMAEKLPLAQYMDYSFQIMRNDALDRFGTPLEQRFAKLQIIEMLEKSGFGNIAFSDNPPYWHCIATKLD